MSAHVITITIKGKGLTKYTHDALKEILNKDFEYTWFNDTESIIDDDMITIYEVTKEFDFDMLCEIMENMEGVEEMYYHLVPYWKYECMDEDGCQDEFGYWSNNHEYLDSVFGDHDAHQQLFKLSDDEASTLIDMHRDEYPDDIDACNLATYEDVINRAYSIIETHEFPEHFELMD